jgi:hypothetical protein
MMAIGASLLPLMVQRNQFCTVNLSGHSTLKQCFWQGAIFARAFFLFALATFHAALHIDCAFQASSPKTFQGRLLREPTPFFGQPIRTR